MRRHQCLGDAASLVSASRGSRIGRRFRVTSIVTHIVARTFTLELRGGALAFALFAVEFDRAGVVLLHSGPYRRGRRTRLRLVELGTYPVRSQNPTVLLCSARRPHDLYGWGGA